MSVLNERESFKSKGAGGQEGWITVSNGAREDHIGHDIEDRCCFHIRGPQNHGIM